MIEYGYVQPSCLGLSPARQVVLIFRYLFFVCTFPEPTNIVLSARPARFSTHAQHLTRGNLEPRHQDLAPAASLRKRQRLFSLPLARTGAFSPCSVTPTTSCCCCTADGCRSEESNAVRQGGKEHGVEAQVPVSFALDQRTCLAKLGLSSRHHG